MFLTTPSRTDTFRDMFQEDRNATSSRLSSRMARRDTTMFPRARSIFKNHEGLRCTHQRRNILDRADIDLRTRQECHSTTKVDCKATFNTVKDNTSNALVLSYGIFRDRSTLLHGGLSHGIEQFHHRGFQFFPRRLQHIVFDFDLGSLSRG